MSWGRPTPGTDCSLAKTDPIKLVGAPADCKFDYQRPNDGAANAQAMGEDNFLAGGNSNYGAMFANKITVKCP